MLHKFVPVAAVLLSAVCPLAAQETPAIRAEIRMLAFTSDLQHAEAYAQDPAGPDTAVAVKAPIKTYLNHQFSIIQFKSRKIVFTTKPDRASLTREGELIGEVTLPDDVNSAILLFLPSKAGGKSLCQIMAINDSKKAFPSGSYHATNLSALPIRLMLEKKNYDFKPGQEILIEDPPVREGRQSGMRTFAFKDNAWMPVATGLWPHPGDARGVLVLFQNPASGDVQLRAFDDDPPRVAATPGTASPATAALSR